MMLEADRRGFLPGGLKANRFELAGNVVQGFARAVGDAAAFTEPESLVRAIRAIVLEAIRNSPGILIKALTEMDRRQAAERAPAVALLPHGSTRSRAASRPRQSRAITMAASPSSSSSICRSPKPRRKATDPSDRWIRCSNSEMRLAGHDEVFALHNYYYRRPLLGETGKRQFERGPEVDRPQPEAVSVNVVVPREMAWVFPVLAASSVRCQRSH
jgi:hypothetical protein